MVFSDCGGLVVGTPQAGTPHLPSFKALPIAELNTIGTQNNWEHLSENKVFKGHGFESDVCNVINM